MAELQPELYQLVGAALRDVAQARFMSDIFSRQIAFVYESDGVLRRFPVPRVDIDEAELTLHFVVKEVAVDPQRRSSRNAAIGALFDRYSTRIVREAMQLVREQTRTALASAADDDTRSALAAFEKRFLSEEHRELLTGRLLQYLNESVEKIIRDDGTLNTETVMGDLKRDVGTSVLDQAEAVVLKAHFRSEEWSALEEVVQKGYRTQVDRLGDEIAALRDKYPDYRITIDPSAAATPGATLSTIRIKSSVRNYKWSKVDVDEADLRNIRTLNPE